MVAVVDSAFGTQGEKTPLKTPLKIHRCHRKRFQNQNALGMHRVAQKKLCIATTQSLDLAITSFPLWRLLHYPRVLCGVVLQAA
jgi:hypothetical protein